MILVKKNWFFLDLNNIQIEEDFKKEKDDSAINGKKPKGILKNKKSLVVYNLGSQSKLSNDDIMYQSVQFSK